MGERIARSFCVTGSRIALVTLFQRDLLANHAFWSYFGAHGGGSMRFPGIPRCSESVVLGSSLFTLSVAVVLSASFAHTVFLSFRSFAGTRFGALSPLFTHACCRLPLPPDASSRRLITNLDWPEVKSSYVLSPTDHHDFFWVTASRTLYYMGISAQTFFLYFLKDVAKMSDPETGVTILSSVAQLAAACSAYPVGMLSDKLGKGRKLFIYVACAILAIGNASFIFCRSLLAVCIISGLIGVGNGGYLAMDSALAIDTLPNKHEAAKFLGIWGVASFLGTALGPMVGGPLLYFVGRTDVEGVYSVQGYAILLCMSVVYFVCAALVLRKVEKG